MDLQLDQVRNFSQLPSLHKWLRWLNPKTFKIILCHFYTSLHFILCDFALLLHETSASLLLILSLKDQVQSSSKAALLLFSLLIMSSFLWLCFVLFFLLPPIGSCLPKALSGSSPLRHFHSLSMESLICLSDINYYRCIHNC